MKTIFSFLFLFSITFSIAQKPTVYQAGEFFSFAVSYGFINAGHATLELSEVNYNNKKVFFAKGYGYTSGMTKMMFKVEDHYQSYFDKLTGEPCQSVRKIHEGGYTKNNVSYFDKTKNTVLVKDLEDQTEKSFTVPNQIQDVVSAFYYLRNHPVIDTIKEGETVAIDMFFDNEVLNFKLKFLRREIIKTKFGKVATMVFRPYVQEGRIFKESESLTMWISDDQNRIPMRIKAELLIGSLKADLEKCKGVKYPLATR